MDPSRTYISPPVIAALQDKVRTTALRQMLAGHYGPITRRGLRNTPYVPLAAVEGYIGLQFSEAQIERAVAGHLDRILILGNQEVV
jgi:hypothetical protein